MRAGDGAGVRGQRRGSAVQGAGGGAARWGSHAWQHARRPGRPSPPAARREKVWEREREGNLRFGLTPKAVVVYTNLKHWKVGKEKSPGRASIIAGCKQAKC